MTAERISHYLTAIGCSPLGVNSSGWVVARCPFSYLHSRGVDRNPSFFVKVDPYGSSGYNCFSCKASGGSVSSLLRKHAYHRGLNLSKLIAEAELDDIPDEGYGNFETFGANAREAIPLDRELFDSLFPPVVRYREGIAYLRKRGIRARAINSLNLRYDPDQRRVVFPVYDQNENLYGFSGRSVMPDSKVDRQKNPKIRDYAGLPKSCLLLGEHLYRPGDGIVLIEGLMGEARAIQYGYKESVTYLSTMSAALSDEQATRLIDFGEPVYVLYDDDEAGDIGIETVVKRLSGELPVFVCYYPKHATDVDNFTEAEFNYVINHTYLP